jgi:hypothetical protein
VPGELWTYDFAAMDPVEREAIRRRERRRVDAEAAAAVVGGGGAAAPAAAVPAEWDLVDYREGADPSLSAALAAALPPAYYFHSASGTSTWERPAFKPSPQEQVAWGMVTRRHATRHKHSPMLTGEGSLDEYALMLLSKRKANFDLAKARAAEARAESLLQARQELEGVPLPAGAGDDDDDGARSRTAASEIQRDRKDTDGDWQLHTTRTGQRVWVHRVTGATRRAARK